MPRPDDDALSWDGDDDPTLDVGGTETAEPAAPATEYPSAPATGEEAAGTAVAEEAPVREDDAPAEKESDTEPRRLGDVALVALGVIGGVYALWTAGWVVGSMRLHAMQGADTMFLASMVLGIAAPAIWFLTTWVLTRGRATWIRFVALLGGVVVLVPWPFVMVGAIGQ
ncbi:MAG: hypothetical protein ACTHZX_03075 [Microbacterium sp.]